MFLRTVEKVLAAGANYFTYKIGSGEGYLLGVNLQEKDSLDQTQYDAGSVYVQDVNAQNAISLANGWLEGGQLAAFGCLPVQAGWEIKGVLWHARADYIGQLNLLLSPGIASYKQGAGFGSQSVSNFNWTPRPPVRASFPAGKLKIVTAEGAATVLKVDLRPDDGYMWQVLDAVCYHDDAGQTLMWNYYDGTTTMNGAISAGMGANDTWSIHSIEGLRSGSGHQIMLSRRVYAQANAGALVAGKKLYIRALVLEMAYD